jgi:hypothetical protein
MRAKDARTCAIISIDGWLRMGEVVMMTVRRSLSDMFKAATSAQRAQCNSRLFAAAAEQTGSRSGKTPKIRNSDGWRTGAGADARSAIARCSCRCSLERACGGGKGTAAS